MLAFEEAQQRIVAEVVPLGAERVGVAAALDRVLAETLVAREPMPAFDYSAMDGYAVATAAFRGDGPWSLPTVGESRTGGDAPALAAGTACRIFTGARLPSGADAVVMQEDVEHEGDRARFSRCPDQGQNVRRAGEDLAAGAVALHAGARLGPAQIGLVAALDRAHVLVARRPRVTVLCTGDELRAPGDPPRPGSIPESNGLAIAAMVTRAGGTATLAPFARDDRAATVTAVQDALVGCDLLITVGGVSVGDHDVVRPALEAAGARLDFWKVRIRPGKPLVSGHAGRVRVLGLPGNPVSAQVTFALFGVPLLRVLQGDRHPFPSFRRAKLGGALHQKPGRKSFYRAVLEGEIATPIPNQASGAPTSMAWANCLVVVPEDSTGFAAGAEVSVLALSDL